MWEMWVKISLPFFFFFFQHNEYKVPESETEQKQMTGWDKKVTVNPDPTVWLINMGDLT